MATRKEDRKMIAALLREREGYDRRGEKDRVRQVDEQLAHYGYEPEQEPKEKAPSGRTSSPAKTADASTPTGQPDAAAAAAGDKATAKPAAARARSGAAAKADGGKAEPAKE